jgi:hypothetical protein
MVNYFVATPMWLNCTFFVHVFEHKTTFNAFPGANTTSIRHPFTKQEATRNSKAVKFDEGTGVITCVVVTPPNGES